MTGIDPTKIASIFRLLSVKSSEGGELSPSIKDKPLVPTDSLRIEKDDQRDKKKLRQTLKLQLKKLKDTGANLEEKAPDIVIKEILLWEFGEDFFNHPQFNNISKTVVAQIFEKKKTKDYFSVMIAELLEDD